MDFILSEITVIDEEKNIYGFSLIPDPRVWELIEHEGKEAWYNRLDRCIIPMDEFKKAVENMGEIPLVTSSIDVEAIDEYVEKSKKRVKEDIS